MKQKSVWACKECGHTQSKWSGSCQTCQGWNTFVEELIADEKQRFESKNSHFARPVLLKEVVVKEDKRLLSGQKEFDALLGGGVVRGSLVLVGGDPGIGKSTLLLQLSSFYAKQGQRVLYVCGEESVEQTSLRARRLKISADNLFLLNETFFGAIKKEIEEIAPDVVIIDSIQVLYKSEIGSFPGSIVQLRELASEFMHLAKGCGITIFLIGHVTKTGELAGPKVLEHIVDTVLEFEGDRQHGFRLLRSIKNRFGPTDDIVLYQMKEEGLKEVPNPSFAFLEERKDKIAGSAIVPALEGARSILIEVQALVASSPFSSPSRRSTGFDQTRLALLLAVLEKRVGFQLLSHDVFLSIAGGLKICDPAVDLAVVAAVASSFSSKCIASDLAIIGEVGLGGEVRRVSKIENRLKEVMGLGFKRCLLPKLNLDKLNRLSFEKLELIGVNLVDEAISYVL